MEALYEKKVGVVTENDMKEHVANSFFSPSHWAGQQAFSRQT